MKKYKKSFFLGTFVLSLLMVFSACFNPMGFDLSSIHFTAELDITGDIYTTDVTAAVLVLINRSRSINVTEVVITQPDFRPDARNVLPYETSFTNLPRPLEKKAVYLNPSQHNYNVRVFYLDDGKVESQAVNVPLPLPRQIVEVHIFRDTEGKVVISIGEETTPDPDDTGIPADDPKTGEGSVPAIIPPANRTRMATYVVINRTNSQVIDKVSFSTSDQVYNMGKVNRQDRQSIALGQGTWAGVVSYIVNNNPRYV
jgi:hypothetical protein